MALMDDYKPSHSLALGELPAKIDGEHKNSRKRKNCKSSKRFNDSVKQMTMEFGRKSTIHAMNRLFQTHSSIYERSFWLFTLVLALLSGIYVCLILSHRYNAGSLQTVVDTTNKPVFEIPFPEVAICNENDLNWDRIEEAKSRFMPNENNTEKIQLFESVIGLYDDLEFGEFYAFDALQGKPLELVKNINFSLVFDFMTWRCEEFLTDCVWHHFKVNCCEIFSKSRSLNGICWHFNTLSTEEGMGKMLTDDKYPWRIGSAGKGSALSLRVLINEDKHYRKDNEKGITVSIMQPEVFHRDPYWIPANTVTAIEVDPVVYLYDNETRALSPAKRQCYFNDERADEGVHNLVNFDYMIENCEVGCRQEYMLRYCNCTMDLMFPQDKYRSCRVEDLLCLAKYNDNFRFIYELGEEELVKSIVQPMTCKCFRNCYSLNYITDVRPSFLPRYLRQKLSFVDLDVHYRSEKMMVYRTSLVVDWVDLMVAFGGIAGLFLGCSLISGIELLYFVLVEVPVLLFKELQYKRKTRKLENLHYSKLDSKQMPRKNCNWGLNNRVSHVNNMPRDHLFFHENFNYKYDNPQQYFRKREM